MLRIIDFSWQKVQIVLATLLMMAGMVVNAAPPEHNGKTIFMSRCATCHNVNKRVVGPALAGIEERRSLDWIVKFVQSSQAVIKSGDEQALAVFAEYNKMPMPDHADLSAEDISDIVSFISSESKTAETTTAPFARPGKLRPAYLPVTSDNYFFFGGLFMGVALLVFALLMLVRVKEIQRNAAENEASV